MEKVTLSGVERVDVREEEKIKGLINAHGKDVHYLAFARQLYGFSPLGTWLSNNAELKDMSDEIINALIGKKELCSLFPKEKLTLYPMKKVAPGDDYYMDLADNDRNFADILYLNDNVYKTEYLAVDFDHLETIQKHDYELIISSLQDLLKKSKKLKEIVILDKINAV